MTVCVRMGQTLERRRRNNGVLLLIDFYEGVISC